MLCKNAYWISYAYVKFERAHPESWRIGLWPITCVITQVLFLHCCRKVGSPPRWTDDVKNRSKFVDGGGSRPVVVNHDSLHIIYARPIFYSFAFPMKRINNFFPAQLLQLSEQSRWNGNKTSLLFYYWLLANKYRFPRGERLAETMLSFCRRYHDC